MELLNPVYHYRAFINNTNTNANSNSNLPKTIGFVCNENKQIQWKFLSTNKTEDLLQPKLIDIQRNLCKSIYNVLLPIYDPQNNSIESISYYITNYQRDIELQEIALTKTLQNILNQNTQLDQKLNANDQYLKQNIQNINQINNQLENLVKQLELKKDVYETTNQQYILLNMKTTNLFGFVISNHLYFYLLIITLCIVFFMCIVLFMKIFSKQIVKVIN